MHPLHWLKNYGNNYLFEVLMNIFAIEKPHLKPEVCFQERFHNHCRFVILVVSSRVAELLAVRVLMRVRPVIVNVPSARRKVVVPPPDAGTSPAADELKEL